MVFMVAASSDTKPHSGPWHYMVSQASADVALVAHAVLHPRARVLMAECHQEWFSFPEQKPHC